MLVGLKGKKLLEEKPPFAKIVERKEKVGHIMDITLDAGLDINYVESVLKYGNRM